MCKLPVFKFLQYAKLSDCFHIKFQDQDILGNSKLKAQGETGRYKILVFFSKGQPQSM